MGLRGPGAARVRHAREAVGDRHRRFPWLKGGLTRQQRVIAFLQWLPITKGPLAGKRMKLLAEQREFVEAVYGNVDHRGIRRIRLAVKSEPKGNGKTGLVAGLCLCHLIGPESERRGEIYSAAIDRQQAALIYAEMEAIILAVPEFALICNPVRFHKRIEVLDGPAAGSIYEALSADARRAHGLSPSLFAYDELAQAKDRVLLDNLINGLGKRKEALGLIISTQAPDDQHPLSQIIDDGLTGADPSLLVHLLAAPEDADPFAEATWKACNPALGIFLSLDEMRTAAARAKRNPSFEPAFLNLRLNQRVDASEEERLVTGHVWKDGAVPVDRAALKGRTCLGALDLSGKHDLTSLTLVFPSDDAEPKYDVLPFFWTPEGAMAERSASERERFREWLHNGHLIGIPGPIIRLSVVARFLSDLSREFNIVAIGYDEWRMEDFEADLREVDPGFSVPLEKIRQGMKTMAPAVETFVEMAMTGRIRHGNHPVLTSAVAGAILRTDLAGNKMIDKGKSNSRGPVRVDGAVTLAMALELAKRMPVLGPSIYETRGILELEF